VESAGFCLRPVWLVATALIGTLRRTITAELERVSGKWLITAGRWKCVISTGPFQRHSFTGSFGIFHNNSLSS
jgi:hypothetical protein